MYILDKNKDYYDYLAKEYGVDKTIVYDRRGSVPLTRFTFLKMIAPSHIEYDRRDYFYNKKKQFLFVVEVGTTQYLFGISDIKYITRDKVKSVYEPYSCTYKLLNTYKENKHYYDKEMTIVPMERRFGNWWYSDKSPIPFSELNELKEHRIVNPILKDTAIPSYINAIEVWKDLSNYISSKYNDKTITIVNSDVEMAINHGFDKRTSFRHPIKFEG